MMIVQNTRPIIPKRDMNRYLKGILKKLSKTVPSLMELYPTALSHAEIRKEQLYQKMCKKKEKGEKLDAEKNKYFKKMKTYAEEHNGSPLYMCLRNTSRWVSANRPTASIIS